MEGSPCESQAGGVGIGDQSAPWLAVYTRPRHEEKVRNYCEERGIEVFLPIHHRWQHWSDRRKLLSLPLFPSYVFVKPDAVQRKRTVQAPGFLWFIHNSCGPVEVDQTELTALRRTLSVGLSGDPLPLIEIGDEVEITASALQGCHGRLASKSGRELILRVSAINTTVRVRLPDPSWVRPISRPRRTTATLA